jgi:hypothetical protein
MAARLSNTSPWLGWECNSQHRSVGRPQSTGSRVVLCWLKGFLLRERAAYTLRCCSAWDQNQLVQAYVLACGVRLLRTGVKRNISQQEGLYQAVVGCG